MAQWQQNQLRSFRAEKRFKARRFMRRLRFRPARRRVVNFALRGRKGKRVHFTSGGKRIATRRMPRRYLPNLGKDVLSLIASFL